MNQSNDSRSTRAVSERVVDAVAAAIEKDPLDLRAKLHDVVDPDALDSAFAPRYDGIPRPGGRMEFEFAGCTVIVKRDSSIEATSEQSTREAPSSPQDDREHETVPPTETE